MILEPPIWVWPLLALLLYFGIKASRVRTTTGNPYYFIPLLGMFSAYGIAKMEYQAIAWFCFIAGYITTAILAHAQQKNWILGKSDNRIILAGEWISMTTFMIVFWSDYAREAISVVKPELHSEPVFIIFFSAIAGSAAGSFLGRSIRILRA